MKIYTTLKDFHALPQAELDKYQAIVKPLTDGRRMLVGFELKSRRARDYRKKLWLSQPLIIEEVMSTAQK